MNSPSLVGQGGSLFSGFTHLCKGISAILVVGYTIIQSFPPAVSYLALIPAKTFPFAWTLITAGYIEQSLWAVFVNIVVLLFTGKLLEPIWGSKEFFKFVVVVNFFTSVCIFVTAIALYFITRQERYLYILASNLKGRSTSLICYTPLCGFHGVLSGLVVGIKQIIPEQELGVLKIKAKWMPSLIVLVAIVMSFFIADSASYLPTLIFGTYVSWIYLRYFQMKPEINLRGDPSVDFAFSTFFPDFLRPFLDPIASVFDRILCGRSSRISDEAKGHRLGGMELPGSDTIEASRRRERGARALEERLAAEKSAQTSIASIAKDRSPGDAAENV